MAVNRTTLGMDRFSFFPMLKKWRIADVILIPVAFVLNYFLNLIDPPFQRQFYVNDLTINHPYAEHERVPNKLNILVSFVIPLAVIIGLSFLLGNAKHRVYLAYISCLGLFVSFFVNELVTDILKNKIGRHRPDFIARCQPLENTPYDTLVFAKDVCTTDDLDTLADGFRTTPSGHSSTAFSCLGYLSLWLMGQLLTEHPISGSWRKVVALVPALGAALIAISRTEDYRHHFVDVILGSILGACIAYWSYKRNFPELTSTLCFKPILDDSDVTADEIIVAGTDASEDPESHLMSSQGTYQAAPTS